MNSIEFSNTLNVNFSAMFECVLQEDAHIRQKTFKVTIPALFPNTENKFTPTKNTKTIDTSRLHGKSPIMSDNVAFKTTTVIEARNFTDYHYRLKGDIFKEKMEGVDGITEPFEIAENAYTDIKSHTHDIVKPMSLFNFIFENINNVKVPMGTKAYGFFLNGTYDTTKFVVTRIEGAVPLQEDVMTNYQK